MYYVYYSVAGKTIRYYYCEEKMSIQDFVPGKRIAGGMVVGGGGDMNIYPDITGSDDPLIASKL